MKSVFRRWSLLASIMLLAVMTACGNQSSTPTAEGNKAEVEAPAAGGQSDAKPADPKETVPATEAPAYVADEEKAKELSASFGDQTPSKAVIASVSLSEIMNIIGVLPVGVPTSTIELPETFKDVKRIGSALKPDIEQITSLQPDIIIGPASIKDSLEKTFKPASLKTAYLPSDSLEELKLATVVLGRVFKQEEKANAFLQDMVKQEQEIIAQVNGKTAPKVMFLFGSAESFMMMNEKTFAGSIAKQLGASNVVSDVLKSEETYVTMNLEDVVTANPDVILLVSHGDPDAALKQFEDIVKKNGAWEKLNAFQNNKVNALDYNLFGAASVVKAVDAYKQMIGYLYS